MPQETNLIVSITVALVAAFLGGVVAARLGVPTIVGYMLAGMVLGPFTPGPVGNVRIASALAEIGVVLLMFGVGIHFSLRDLLTVRGIAVPGALGLIAVATALGTGLALQWGWKPGAGLVFGLALSVASTVVLVRALAEWKLLDTVHGRVAVGWLIVEDLFTVFVLVLLPALAVALGGEARAGLAARVGGGNLLPALGLALGKTVAFVAVMIFVGGRLVPWLLVQAARTGSRELFTLSVLAVALGIAVGSAKLFGVSLALGAFLAGLVISESDLSHQAAADALPMRDAFAVLFFLSIGMLFDPRLLLHGADQVLAVLALILVSRAVAVPVVLLLGWPLRTALVVGAGRAQIGEFSFIVAALGQSLGLLSERGFQLIIAVSLLSIMLNPLMFRAIGPLEHWLRQRPRVNTLRERRSGRLIGLPEEVEEALRDHAVIIGYGRVGSLIGELLDQHSVPHVVVELNRRRVEELRRRGLPAIYGDAANPTLLTHAHIDRARVLVVAIPDAPAARLIVDYARRLRPDLDIIVRTHSDTEWRYMRERVGEAVLGEREAALEMARYTLVRFGVSPSEVEAIIARLRGQAQLGAEEAPVAASSEPM